MFRRADILPDGSAVLSIRPVLPSDPYAQHLPRSSVQRMNFSGSILIKEEEKIEQLDYEEDESVEKGVSDAPRGLFADRPTRSGSDASFGQIYDEKSKYLCNKCVLPASN